jgi:hypothetical protein
MNIKELRIVLDEAAEKEGLALQKLGPRRPKGWSLPEGEVLRFFVPGGSRRTWGFVFDGFIGIEIPSLRQWLNDNKSGSENGIFHSFFVGYHTANDSVLRSFVIDHGDPVPADLWAGLISDRLKTIPPTLDELVRIYRSDREKLGWLAHPHQRPAWEFLLKWHADPDPSLPVPRMLPDGRIV